MSGQYKATNDALQAIKKISIAEILALLVVVFLFLFATMERFKMREEDNAINQALLVCAENNMTTSECINQSSVFDSIHGRCGCLNITNCATLVGSDYELIPMANVCEK